MRIDERACYRALETRDPRFDGRFFVGVASTRVYCRPICPARTPKRSNVRFFTCAASAQEAGYRPCLRCRPESAPGSPAWMGTSSTIQRALRLIDEGALDTGNATELALRLGIGERHLRRLFARHLGTSPDALARTRRVLFAKQLLDETQLGMAQIARAAGFTSVRRFNATLRSTYGVTPTTLRGRRTYPASGDLRLFLAFRPPYAWETQLDYLRARAVPGVERVTNSTYERTFAIAGEKGTLRVSLSAHRNALEVRIQGSHAAALLPIVTRLRRLFDLDADPAAINAHLRRDPRLRPAVRKTPGLRLPGAWDGFELAVRAILGQQISVRAATTLAGRLARLYGDPLLGVSEPTHVFPSALALADADFDGIGITGARMHALRSLARAVCDGTIRFDGTQESATLLESLRAIDGIGEWSCAYIAMRVLQDPDAFPAGDLGLRRSFAKGKSRPSARDLEQRAEPWRPWRAYATFHLWREEAERVTRQR